MRRRLLPSKKWALEHWKPLNCPYCQKRFRALSDMNRHINLAHSDTHVLTIEEFIRIIFPRGISVRRLNKLLKQNPPNNKGK